jgi:hypothetical protein
MEIFIKAEKMNNFLKNLFSTYFPKIVIFFKLHKITFGELFEKNEKYK